MSQYHPPINELRFALRTHGFLDEILNSEAGAGLDIDTVDAILEEAGKFAAAGWAEANHTGDVFGVKLEQGRVATDPAYMTVYRDFCDAGWISLHMNPEYGGQGLPSVIASACEEMWYAGNLALSLLPMLTGGAVSAIEKHASAALKAKFLPNMCAGLWSGTMNLTEPQAGSDLAQVKTRATPIEGGYAISGQKIFITWGEHELCENIIHLVLARLPDAPAGVKGISLFIVPKFLVNDDGSLGARNTVECVSVEHKLGIHGSPTCVMQFENATGYLVGEPGRGLMAMFTMMNHARLGVGIEGVAVADRAFDHARSYAKERVQSRPISQGQNPVNIIQHPDVRRMLLVQKATIEAQRALYVHTAALLDKAHHATDAAAQQIAQNQVDFMIPIVKGCLSESGVQLTNLAMQVFGGMGYVEETGAAQFVRDVRITPIYEGTSGIQALDFIGRKTASNQGQTATLILQNANTINQQLAKVAPALAEKLQHALSQAQSSVDFVVKAFADEQPQRAAAGSFAYLMQMGTVLGGVEMARAYLACEDALQNTADAVLPADFYRVKKQTVGVYFDYILPFADAYARQLLAGDEALLAVAIDDI